MENPPRVPPINKDPSIPPPDGDFPFIRLPPEMMQAIFKFALMYEDGILVEKNRFTPEFRLYTNDTARLDVIREVKNFRRVCKKLSPQVEWKVLFEINTFHVHGNVWMDPQQDPRMLLHSYVTAMEDGDTPGDAKSFKSVELYDEEFYFGCAYGLSFLNLFWLNELETGGYMGPMMKKFFVLNPDATVKLRIQDWGDRHRDSRYRTIPEWFGYAAPFSVWLHGPNPELRSLALQIYPRYHFDAILGKIFPRSHLEDLPDNFKFYPKMRELNRSLFDSRANELPQNLSQETIDACFAQMERWVKDGL